ncbi:hypothetical protein [Rufibacter latericius]|uniref:DUF4369 domain-containing protein n=1 Tax=Rufibacter latericius TaxID=2487040 RepID=A0A3M9MK50_9BACT|nr:hypothetical protein [Rufibacter latericius]RNI25894.1 hypothetical protein EFB08_13710 [Rufibacter latericius]
MNPNRIILLVLLLLALANQKTTAQVYLEEVNGRPIRINQYVNVEGSPYLLDNWSKGTMTLTDGSKYKDIELKYDMVEGILLVKNKHGVVLEPLLPASEFSLEDPFAKRVFINGSTLEKDLSKNPYLEVLSTGKVDLLKRNYKVIREEKAYNSASITKRFVELSTYFIKKGDKLIKVKNDAKSVLAVLGTNQDVLKEYISANKLNLKEDEDLVKLFAFYSTL